jgi:AraC family transcriptional regulator, transcriptional activator of pobA
MQRDGNQKSLKFANDLKLKGFKVYETSSKDKEGHIYSRKDFYKIALTNGKFLFHYADKSFKTEQTFLFFANPHIPYSCEVISPNHNGYTCLFSEQFLKPLERSESLLQSPLFKIGGTPIFEVSGKQKTVIQTIFHKMITEQDSSYMFKDELIRSYISLIIHEALKMQPSGDNTHLKNAAVRISSVFLELLERQFPIENVHRPLELKTANDYAKELSVHVNYLNSAVKQTTGKTTTTHISDRIITEAKALLQHTDWSIADIAYALGFEYPTYFNNFFKKKTGYIPKSLRIAQYL